ncbi:MAG: prepilin-type N-terminal cleavage/methylation domain-containing protein [Fimbriimonadaceae bacterium]
MKRAFTLIELLVVIAIIAILAAILFPVFAQAKNAAKKSTDLSNVKQIATAQILYLTDYDGTVQTNRSCHLWWEPNGPANREPCQPGDVALGWIDLLYPYVKNIQMFKSPGDPIAAVPIPPGTYCYHWERNLGQTCTARGGLTGFIWGNRFVGGRYVPLGGDFRSSYARNNNFANNGVYTATESEVQYPSNTIMIYPMLANTGGGANPNEGVPGSTYNINRKDGVAGGFWPSDAPGTPNSSLPECVLGDVNSQWNNRVSFVHTQFGTSHPVFGLESGEWSSRRFSGGSNYAMFDTSARFLKPERVKGQCNWGPGRRPEFGNDGTTPDFRL